MGFIDSIFNLGSQIMTNQSNRDLTYQQWNRDDNAVQRRVADLKAAGLSPVLAAGSAASSSAPIPMRQPVIGGLDEEARFAADMVLQKKNIERTDAEIAAINAKAAPDKLMARVLAEATNYVNEDGSPIINKLARNWLNSQNAAADNAIAAAKERSLQAALLNRLYSFDVEKGVYNPEMRNMAATTEFFRNMVNSGDTGDWIGAVLQLIGKINK